MSKVSRTFAAMNALLVVSSLIGLANNVIIAAMFGLTRRVDAFFAASMLPGLFMILFVDYLGKNFLPAFARARKESEAQASQLTSSIITIVFLVAVSVMLLLAAFGPWAFGVLLPGFDPEDLHLVTRYFWIMAPAVVLAAATIFNEYVCQHDEKFVAIMGSKVALPLANLACILLAGPFIGEYALPVGYLLGHMIVFALVAWVADYRFVPSISVRPEWERRIFANSLVVMSTGFVARSRNLIMNFFASTLGGGAIATLGVANKLTSPLERGAFTSVRMLMFSRTARLHVEQAHSELAGLYDFGLSASVLVLVPILWWVGLNAEVIIQALLMRGAFDGQMAALVSAALLGLLPSVLFLGLNQLLSNAFYAIDKIRVPAIVMPFGTVAFLCFAWLLSSDLGLLGLAVAMSASTAVVFVALYAALVRLLEGFRGAAVAARMVVYTAAGWVCFASAMWVLVRLGMTPGFRAVFALMLGSVLYGLVLGSLRDTTFLRILRYAWEAVRLRGA